MNLQHVALAALIEPAPLERAGNRDLPILSMTMHEGLVNQASKFKKRVASADTGAYKLVRRNQLVVGFPIDEGVLSFQDLYDAAIVSPAYDVWDLRETHEVDTAYLERFLRSPRAMMFYRTKLRGTTARRRTLPDDIFLKLDVPLPSRADQRRISTILDKSEALRSKRRVALGLLDRLRQSIFVDMFGSLQGDQLRWPVVPFERIVRETKLGLVRGSTEFGPEFPTPYVRMNAITNTGELDLTDVQRTRASEAEIEAFRLQPGDFLFNTRNSRELVGKTALYRGGGVHVFNNNLMRVRFTADANAEFIAAAFRTLFVQRELDMRKSGTTNVFAIYYKDLRTLPLPLPPLALQQTFARAVTVNEELKKTQRASLAQHDELFATLQHRAFRGELF